MGKETTTIEQARYVAPSRMIVIEFRRIIGDIKNLANTHADTWRVILPKDFGLSQTGELVPISGTGETSNEAFLDAMMNFICIQQGTEEVLDWIHDKGINIERPVIPRQEKYDPRPDEEIGVPNFVRIYGADPREQNDLATIYAEKFPDAKVRDAFSTGFTCGSNARLILLRRDGSLK